MKTGGIVALVVVPVVLLGGGAAAYFIIKKRKATGGADWQVQPRQDNRQLAAAQMTAGPANVANSGGGGGLNVSGIAAGVGGKYLDSVLPGSGKYAGAIISNTNSVLKKIPGIGSLGSKLKLW